MDTSTRQDTSALNDRENDFQIRQKWGNAVGKGGLTGFLALPEVLLRGQHRLGLTSTEMLVLINILLHWWRADTMPFPSNSKIAKRMGIDIRTVQRAVKQLEAKKLINRRVKINHDPETGAYSSVRRIDLTKLVARLSEIAIDLGEYSQSVRSRDGGTQQG